MKNRTKIYFLWVLVIANLIYAETWGLNALIITLISVPLLAWKDGRLFFDKKIYHINQPENTGQWWLVAATWLTASLAVFFTASFLAVFFYFVTLIYFTAVQQPSKTSFVLGFGQTVQSFFTGVYRVFHDFGEHFKTGNLGQKKKWLIQTLMVLVPLLIVIIFFKLYQIADVNFYELTKFINLDWISWGFIFVYILLVVFLYGLYYFKPLNDVVELEKNLKNEINQNYQDKVQNFFGVKQERKLALVLFISLSALLCIYLTLDVHYLFDSFGTVKADSFYSNSIHEGIGAVIFSIVLVIILITYFFRGSLNFEQHRLVKNISRFWLLLNSLLLITTGAKNFEYVTQLGLTGKRLGVYLYLILSLVGLILTIYKITKSLSIWYLIRSSAITFIFVFSLIANINWHRFIAEYNLKYVSEQQLDLWYIYELGPDAYPALMDYHIAHNLVQTDLGIQLANNLIYERSILANRMNRLTWRSFNYADYYLAKQLNRFNIIFPNNDEGQPESNRTAYRD